MYICITNNYEVAMSLLKSILNMVLKTAVESMNQRDEQPVRPAAATPSPEPVRETISNFPAYFAEILSTEFPQYTTKRNVPVTDLAGNATDEFKLYKTRPQQSYKAEWGAPYSFVLYQGEAPVGVVMLGEGSSHSRNVKYLISRMYAKKMGLPYINFYTQFPNERTYVINRIRELMNS